MKQLGLVSNYTVAQYKPYKQTSNEAPIKNELQRQFKPLAVIVSDLTYVRVEKKWHYVCLFVDLFNRAVLIRIKKDDCTNFTILILSNVYLGVKIITHLQYLQL